MTTATANHFVPTDYDDYAYYADYYPAYEAVYNELTAEGKYPYNDCFKGRIPGLSGPGEDRAIYRLQGLRRIYERMRRVDELLAEGYEWVESLEGITRFRAVALVPMHSHAGPFKEYENVRVVPVEEGRPAYVLPPRKRTHGYLVGGRAVLGLAA